MKQLQNLFVILCIICSSYYVMKDNLLDGCYWLLIAILQQLFIMERQNENR